MPAISSGDSAVSADLALEIARFGLVGGASDVAALRKVAELASRAVPGCSGATVIRWERADPPEPLVWVGSHPSLAEIADLQLAQGDGPSFAAARTGDEQWCADTLTEVRWPRLVPAMLRRGVRCFTTAVYEADGILVTLTLYGVLPGALQRRPPAIAALLLGQGGAAVSNARQYGHAHRTAVQLQEAVESRAVVDQAKGILMHALGCDADAAFQELKRISQTRHVKLTALARRIVSGGGT